MQKIVQMTKRKKKEKKNPACLAPYLRNHTSYDCHLLYTCVSLGAFFMFLKF